MARAGDATRDPDCETPGMTTLDLATSLTGSVHRPGDPAYADACTLFNAAIDRHPALVVRPRTPADVAAAIGSARTAGMALAIRGGGHSVSGASLCDDGLVIDMRSLDSIEVDAAARTAKVGGGCLTGAVDQALQAHGLATTLGRVTTTGVAGFTLGGGSNWLERRFGLAVDNLLAAEIVTADGELLSVDEEAHGELFWALRGGGGNFGAVTSLTFRVHHVGMATGGLLLHPAEQGVDLLRQVRDYMATAPDHISIAVLYLYGPDDPSIPEILRGKPTVATWLWHFGPVENAEAELRAIRTFGSPAADFVTSGPYADLNGSMDDPAGYRNYFTADHLGELTDEAIDVVHEHALRLPEGPGWTMLVPWGGAVARPEHDLPLANRDARWVIHPGAFWSDPAKDHEAAAWARSFREDLHPYSSGGVWLNFIGNEGDDRIRAAFGDANYRRLQAVKAAYDPENVFQSNHNVPPSSNGQPPG